MFLKGEIKRRRLWNARNQEVTGGGSWSDFLQTFAALGNGERQISMPDGFFRLQPEYTTLMPGDLWPEGLLSEGT
jgi:hypothetical protein